MEDSSENNSTSEWPNNDDEEPELFNELFGHTQNDSNEAMEVNNENSRSSSTDSASSNNIREKGNTSKIEDMDQPTELFRKLFGKSDETDLYPDLGEQKTDDEETFVTWDDEVPLQDESAWEDLTDPLETKRIHKTKDPYGGVQYQYLTDSERELKDKIDEVNARIQKETKHRKSLRQRQFRMKKRIVALKQALASELQAISNEKAKRAQEENVAPASASQV